MENEQWRSQLQDLILGLYRINFGTRWRNYYRKTKAQKKAAWDAKTQPAGAVTASQLQALSVSLFGN